MSTRIYPWTTDEDETALDAIVVGIGSDAPALIAAGISVPEPTADVYWAEQISMGDKVPSGWEGPYAVPEALARAEELAVLNGIERIVVALSHRSTWNDAWGTLADEPGVL